MQHLHPRLRRRQVRSPWTGCIVTFLPCRKRRCYTKKPYIGWEPARDERGVATTYQKALSSHAVRSQKPTLEGVTRVLVDAATETIAAKPKIKTHSAETQALLQQRRECRDRVERTQLSKQLFRSLRDAARKRNDSKLDAIIASGAGLKSLRSLQQRPKKKQLFPAMTSEAGHMHSSRGNIAEVFAAFSERLYPTSRSTTAGKDFESLKPNPDIEKVTVSELFSVLKRMRNGRTGSDDGLVVEMLKECCEDLLEVIADLFTSLLRGELDMPTSWRESTLTILFKKGDPKLRKTTDPFRSYQYCRRPSVCYCYAACPTN